MQKNDFEKIMEEFKISDVDKKIEIYITTEGLTNHQYKELLMWFPRTELDRLEEALG